jgi:transposase InsO family protein
VAHSNARTTLYASQLIIQRHHAGWPAAHIADQLGVSRATVHKWLQRHRTEGDTGLLDRTSRPHHSPTRTPPATETAILRLRQDTRRGPVFIAGTLGLAASTVGRVLHRHHVPHLADIDPITGLPVRRRHSDIRYQRHAPGDLLHIDVKKLGRIPDGGGWRVHGRSETVRGRGIGYDYLHVAVDDHSRLAYVEALPDEKDPTSAGFLYRAVTWFRDQGVRVLRLLTDNAKVYRIGGCWRAVCIGLGLRRRFIKPRCPWTNGKAERFNRTLQTEFAYAQSWTSNQQRIDALPGWVASYNTERAHSALAGHPPISRLAT